MKFVFDLDGTICFKGQPVSENILTSLEQLVTQGHEVIFASARPIRDLLPVLNKRFHQHPMIGGNGAIVANNGEIISTVKFDENNLSKITSLIELYDITYLIDGSWNYSYKGPSEHPILRNLDPHRLANNIPLDELGPIIKILMLSSSNLDKVKEELKMLDVVVNVHGNEEVLDISPKGINKWVGLQKLGVKEGEYITFGNDANDMTMFEHATYSIMIGDHALLKQFANEDIPLNNHIEYFLMERLKELGRYYSIIQ